jgi:hypothetical protein
MVSVFSRKILVQGGGLGLSKASLKRLEIGHDR